MLVIMNQDASEQQIADVIKEIQQLGFGAHPIPGETRTAIGITGNEGPVDSTSIEGMSGVIQVVRISKSYKLVSRETKPDDSVIDVTGVRVGGEELVVIAGPCSVESREQIMKSAELTKAAGAHMLRGGAFKPRTSPYAFRGLREQALKWLREAREEFDLPIVSEVLDSESVKLAGDYVDLYQIGARNMQNYTLLEEVARSGKPVLLKRGFSASLDELLNAAEYILSVGNYNVILCERGIRGFSDFSRNTMDLNIIPAVKEISHLPIITDPSHGTGRRNMVLPLARGSIATGADGVIVEMHPEPEKALSDGGQSLYPQQLRTLIRSLREIAPAIGRKMPGEEG